MTRDEVILAAQEMMDGEGAPRWSTTLLLQLLDQTFDAEWDLLLASAPYYRFQSVPVTTGSDGTFPLTDLDTGSGDSEQRFFRILAVNDGNYAYREVRFEDVPLANYSSYLPLYPKIYYLAGTSYQVFPKGVVSLNVVTNWRPPKPSDLSSGDVELDFPDAMVLAYSLAYRALYKGGTESTQAGILRQLADDTRAQMLDAIRRRTTTPTQMIYSDRSSDWSAGR